MNIPSDDADTVTWKGSMKADLYTAQLGVSLTANRQSLTLKSSGRSYCVSRVHFTGLEQTALLGIFKRGLRLLHNQSDLPRNIIFYPHTNRDVVQQQLQQLGWT